MDIEDAVARLATLLLSADRSLNPASTDEGLMPGQFAVLDTVRETGPANIVHLAGVDQVPPPFLANVLRDLAANNLVTFPGDGEDMETSRITTTPMGSLAHGRITNRRFLLLAHAVDKLTEEEIDNLVAAMPTLETLVAAIEAA